MAMNLEQAKDAIRKELENPTFDENSVGKIEGIIAELEAAKVKWKEDPEIANLHERYIAKFSVLSSEVKENLALQINSAKTRQEALKAEVNGIEIPAVVLGNKEVMKQLQALGIVRGDRAVFENTDVAEKITKYIGYLNFISDAERDDRNAITDMKTLVDNYLDITNEGSDWILDKRFLQYKYIEAIYNDIIRRGYVLEKNGTSGEYTIVCPKVATDATGKQYISREPLQDKFPNHEYLRILKGPNTRNGIDVAIVSSIMSKDFALDSHEIVGQKTMITHLLQKHGIKSRSGKNIQKAELMLLDWNGTVLDQVNAKLLAVSQPDDEVSVQSYQELLYLKNFIEREEYMQTDYNRKIFSEANIYRKGFIAEKALIDTYGGGDIANMDEQSIGDIIKNLGTEARGPLVIFGLLAWLMGFKKFAMGSLGLGILGPSVGKMVNAVDNAGASSGLFGDDELELLKPHSVIPRLQNENYQENFETLANLNTKNLSELVDKDGRSLPYVDNNFIIATIINTLDEKDYLNKIDINDPKLAATIYNKLGGVMVTNDDFPNYHGAPYQIHGTDVEQFIELLKASDIEDSNDRTMSDALRSGNDIRNENYESFDFTVDDTFDREINAHLRDRWVANTTIKDRETIQKLKDTIEAKLSAGVSDNFFDSVSGRNTEDVIRGLSERISNIDDLIAEINAMPGLSANSIDPLTDPTKGLLAKYKIFMQADAEMSKYDGLVASGQTFISDKWGDASTFIGNLSGRTGISELQSEKDEIDVLIAKISPANLEVDGVKLTSDPIYNSIIERAKAVVDQLTERSQALQDEINSRNEALRREAFNIPNIAAIDNLSLDEGENAYRDAVVEIKQAADDFSTMVTHFERSGDLSDAFSTSRIEQYTLLNAAKKELEAMTLSGAQTFPSKLWLRIELQKLFKSGAEIDKFKNKAEKEFLSYFSNLKTEKADVAAINTSFTNINDFVTNRDKLNNIERDLGNTISGFESVYAFMRRSDKRSEAEIAYESAQKLFGASFSVSNDTLRTEEIIAQIIEKREELAKGVQAHINGITSSSYNLATLEKLQELDRRGVISYARDSELGPVMTYAPGDSQIEKDYAHKVEKVAIAVIEAVSVDPTGITTLRAIDATLGINANDSLWEKIKTLIGGSDQVERIFNEKVDMVGATILDGFDLNMTGLDEIIRFRNGGNNYEWISNRANNFDSRYDLKLQKIRDAVKSGTSVGAIVSIATISTNLVSGYPRGDARLILEDYETGSIKTISELITLLGLTDTSPSGSHNDFTQADRLPFYNELKRLNILG